MAGPQLDTDVRECAGDVGDKADDGNEGAHGVLDICSLTTRSGVIGIIRLDCCSD